MMTAPPPYIGAMTIPIGSASIETLPSRNSPTKGERKKRPRAGAMRRSMVGFLIGHDRYSAPAREYFERCPAGPGCSGLAERSAPRAGLNPRHPDRALRLSSDEASRG